MNFVICNLLMANYVADKPHNPMVNAGAIMVASLLHNDIKDPQERLQKVSIFHVDTIELVDLVTEILLFNYLCIIVFRDCVRI